jgi:LPS sulfotransferase NodH
MKNEKEEINKTTMKFFIGGFVLVYIEVRNKIHQKISLQKLRQTSKKIPPQERYSLKELN